MHLCYSFTLMNTTYLHKNTIENTCQPRYNKTPLNTPQHNTALQKHNQNEFPATCSPYLTAPSFPCKHWRLSILHPHQCRNLRTLPSQRAHQPPRHPPKLPPIPPLSFHTPPHSFPVAPQVRPWHQQPPGLVQALHVRSFQGRHRIAVAE